MRNAVTLNIVSGNIVSLCDARATRLKESLGDLAARREGAMVRARGGSISACRIFCRDGGVVLIDRYGIQRRLPYGDILGAAPLRGREESETTLSAVKVVAFPRRHPER